MKLPTDSPPRLYFFDNLRAFIIMLMVIFHIGMGYTTWNLAWWTVNDIQKNIFFDMFVLATDVYIMPVMFLIGGYFAPMVLVKKGWQVFCKAKLLRIVLPWLFGVLCIAPFIAYSSLVSRMDTPPNFFVFLYTDFWGPYYQQAHYWFLGILTLFYVLLLSLYGLNTACLNKPLQNSVPSACFFSAFALLTAVTFFFSNLFYWNDAWVSVQFIFMVQPVRLLLHLFYFALGVYAWKNSWFTQGGYSPHLLPWSIAAIIMLFVFLAYRMTFTLMPDVPTLFKAGHALTHSIFALTATFALIAVFQNLFNSNAYCWHRIAENSYIIYFIHQCVVIPIGCLVQQLDINIWVKYSSVSIITLILCFLLAEYVIAPIISLAKQTANT